MALLTRPSAFTVLAAATVDEYADEIERVTRGVFGGSNTLTEKPITKVKRTTAQTINSVTFTTITWQAADIDTGGMWDPGTPNRITFTAPGVWLLVGCPRFSATAGQKRIYCTKNSTDHLTATIGLTDAGAGAAVIQVSIPARFVAGDQVYLVAYQDSGSSQTLGTDVGGTYLNAFWLGP